MQAVTLDLTGGETHFRPLTTARLSCVLPGEGVFVNLTAPARRR